LHKYFQYFKERFPFTQFIPLSLVFSAVAGLGTQVYLNHGSIHLESIGYTAAALFLFLLRLRFFDEFKDFNHDLKYYRNRPVSRGLVKLKELHYGIYFVLAIESIIAYNAGNTAIVFFVVALVYSLLMLKEFFLQKWLRRHFTLYYISHELLIFPLFLYLMSLNGMTASGLRQPYFWLLAAFLGCNLFLMEITRKIRPKTEEIESRDTYSSQYGIAGSAILAFAVSVVAFGIAFYLETITGLGGEWIGSFRFIAFAFLFYTLLIFVRRADGRCVHYLFYASIMYTFISLATFLLKCIYGLL